jgi:biotin-dependent carboxylase-like uncharacterized protein
MIEILKAPPFATVQDLGRPGHRREGVPPAGAMDCPALRWLNRRVGNPDGAAAIEWALGGGRLRCCSAITLAIGPGSASRGTETIAPWSAVGCQAGDELVLDPPSATRFGYLAVGGGIATPPLMGSRSTYLPGGFGGMAGRRLRPGDRLPVGTDQGAPTIGEAVPSYDRVIRVLSGPQAELFDDTAWEALLNGSYAIAAASDRMGYRLDGPLIRHRGSASLLSEPACPGAIQIPDGGSPIVLMPDGPTVGGYPKLGVIASADLGVLAQLVPGRRPRFALASLEDVTP